MILLIDNYDSFTYNIYQIAAKHFEDTIVHRNDDITLDKIHDLKPDKIIISPGPSHPKNSGICSDVIKEFGPIIPMLGICLGHQSIAQAYGASIVECDEIMHGKIDKIEHSQHSLFKGVSNIFEATRYHSLIIQNQSLPKEIEVIAKTKKNIIMGIAHKEKNIFGLQFHPESIGTKIGKSILTNFLNIIKYES